MKFVTTLKYINNVDLIIPRLLKVIFTILKNTEEIQQKRVNEAA